MVVIGSTGTGKSSTLNTLCGKQNEFHVSSGNQSEASETKCKVLPWRGSEKEVRFIDTPGLADT